MISRTFTALERAGRSNASALFARACLGLTLVLLGACATPAPEFMEEPTFVRVSDPDARRQLGLGKPLAAADVYSARAAAASDPEQRQDYLLTAAEILFDRALMEPGIMKLADVPDRLATRPLQVRRDILAAREQLYEGEAERALEQLPDPRQVASGLHRARIYETRAQSFRSLQDPDNELIARIELEAQLGDAEVIATSHQEIWQLLTTQPLSTLRSMTTNVRGDVYQGWIELALANAEAGMNPRARRDGLIRWQQRFSGHPANDAFVYALFDDQETFDGFSAGGEAIEQIAVLLPLSSTATSMVSAAIRDGMIAAHQSSRDRRAVPRLRFYDIGDNPGYVREAYRNAVADGADAVVGPLRKRAVAAIASQRDIPVPTITLNTIETFTGTSSNRNLVQFGLAPEDEARSAASRAAALSLNNAIVLQSDDSRGDREARAFQESLFARGGDVVHVAVLPNEGYDYSEQIRDALEITESDNRFRTLSSTIGQKLFFEPSIRNDVDVVFLAMNSEQARSVRPQLDFFHAAEVPRFGTSRVASLVDDIKINKDLNTVYYTDAPWLIRPSMADDPLRREIIDVFDNVDGVFARLYALGADAYSLVTNLDSLAAGERLEGYTGDLELTDEGQIRRHLDWAQYLDGVSVPVDRIEAEPLDQIVSGTPN